jgi:hypothetical protein
MEGLLHHTRAQAYGCVHCVFQDFIRLTRV